jgi:hypothetical protein
VFSPCERNPEFAPRGKFLPGGEDILHLLACVAGTKRRFVTVVIHIFFLSMFLQDIIPYILTFVNPAMFMQKPVFVNKL